MTITRQGTVRQLTLRGECSRCGCHVSLSPESNADQNRVTTDENGVKTVGCPMEKCGGEIVVQLLRTIDAGKAV